MKIILPDKQKEGIQNIKIADLVSTVVGVLHDVSDEVPPEVGCTLEGHVAHAADGSAGEVVASVHQQPSLVLQHTWALTT